MGRKNKSYHKTIKEQMYDRLTTMLHAGEGTSKREAVANGIDGDKIFSYATYKSYYKHCKYFANWVAEKHPECTTLKAARKHVNTWLQERVDNGGQNGKPLSAWTISLERQALGKLYGIKPDDKDFFVAPRRHREDIVRSRVDTVRDKHFSKTNNDEFIRFCRATGCRRNVLEKLEGRDLIAIADIKKEIAELRASGASTDNTHLNALEDAVRYFGGHEYFIHHRNDKGGRERYSPIIGEDAGKVIARMKATAPNGKVWLVVPGNADIHGYRAEYATAIYKQCARPISEIPYDKVTRSGRRYQSEVYHCRKDEVGKHLDKVAMMAASKALGHNRIDVVANNYIRGL